MKFSEKVYKLTKKIPEGRVSTYKTIAKKLKCRAYRAVGNALNKNPHRTVPCHRVVKNSGFVGGFASGTKNKVKILKSEGVKIKNNKILNFEKVLFFKF
jgi:methylated-DNA-[protein]-cysteine S-methyltransferase